MNQPSNQSMGGAQGYGAQNFAGGQAHGMLNQFGTNPQMVQSHIQQSLHQGQAGQFTNYAPAAGSPMHAGASNPQMVQQQIAQDMGHPGQATNAFGQGAQAGYNHGAMNQVMNAAPAQVQGAHGQQMGMQGAQGYAGQAHYSNAAFGQYATNPQTVQNHIQQDLHGAHQGAQGYAGPAHYSNAAFGQYATNPQTVQNQIQQDLAQGQGAMTSRQAGAMHGQMSYGQGVSSAMTNSAFNQFGTNPQTVRQHIQQDLNNF